MSSEIVCDDFSCSRVAKKTKPTLDEKGELKITKGFGSFFSQNVEVLIDLSAAEYQPPPLPFPTSVAQWDQDQKQNSNDTSNGKDDNMSQSSPPLTAEMHETQRIGVSAPSFGSKMKERYFFLEQDWTYINHGAFGAALKPAVEAAHKWSIHTERQPLRFLDRQLLPTMVLVHRELAAFIGCDAPDVVIVPNATTALNAVFSSLQLKEKERVLRLSIAYSAVKKMLSFYCGRVGGEQEEIHIPLPLLLKGKGDRGNTSHDDANANANAKGEHIIVETVRLWLERDAESFSKNGNNSNNSDSKSNGDKNGDNSERTSSSTEERKGPIRLAIFDHVTSNEALVLPVKELISLCHSYSIPVCIDGAHALGALELNMNKLKADFYISNCHKWMCSPKGVAFMYVDKQHQPSIRPLAISHGSGSGFVSDFIWTGLRDYGPMLSLLTVLDFWNTVGPATIRTHMHALARWAAEMLVSCNVCVICQYNVCVCVRVGCV